MKRVLTVVTAMILFAGCTAKDAEKAVNEAPAAAVETGIFADIATTKGTIIVKLENEKTPLTVCNFVGLAEGKIKNTAKAEGEPYYDGIVFHRVIDQFMIQGGDPTGTGRGGPGYQFGDEIDPTLKHNRAGILSMANAGPGTNGSQFFITHVPTPHLDGKHTVFGHVTTGQDVVNAIRQGDKIVSVTIRRVGKDAEAFTADQAMFDILQADIQKRAAEKREAENAAMVSKIMDQFPGCERAESGYYYVVNAKGSGEAPQNNMKIKAHYNGKFLDGRKFDSSYDRGVPFEFILGAKQVISGWDLAFLDMTKGEKRTIILPPELAYGSRGAGGIIPPNTWLVFDVELVDF